MSGSKVPEEAYAVALAGLPLMTGRRLARLLCKYRPGEAWARLRDGQLDETGGERPVHLPGNALDDSWSPFAQGAKQSSRDLMRTWACSTRHSNVALVWDVCVAKGISVVWLGGKGYPDLLARDQQAPAVLFLRGSISALDYPRVAIVGTRSATHYGQAVASELGAGLGAAGVAVVSGLALGIDRAAHEGALGCRGSKPIGVAGSGIDVVYPARCTRLWERVAEAGLLLSEAPLGAAPSAWRFPVRNRIIAALSQVVVVVESHDKGGSLHTVDAATARGVPVMAVPGSVRSPASTGTNSLLAEGAAPVRDVDDVLVALGLQMAASPHRSASSRDRSSQGQGRSVPSPSASRQTALVMLDGVEGAVLAAIGYEPTSTDAVLARTGLDLGEAASAIDRLEQSGWVCAIGAGWWERMTR